MITLSLLLVVGLFMGAHFRIYLLAAASATVLAVWVLSRIYFREMYLLDALMLVSYLCSLQSGYLLGSYLRDET